MYYVFKSCQESKIVNLELFIMKSKTVYLTGMMVYGIKLHMYHGVSVLGPVLVRVPESLPTSTSTSTSTITLKLTSMSWVRVQEILRIRISRTNTPALCGTDISRFSDSHWGFHFQENPLTTTYENIMLWTEFLWWLVTPVKMKLWWFHFVNHQQPSNPSLCPKALAGQKISPWTHFHWIQMQ